MRNLISSLQHAFFATPQHASASPELASSTLKVCFHSPQMTSGKWQAAAAAPAALAAAIALLALPAATDAQCVGGGRWLPIAVGGVDDLNGQVIKLHVWDADGPGGAAPVLVAAGYINSPQTQLQRDVMMWDGSVWSPLGNGVAAAGIFSLTTDGNGDLIVGGLNFSGAGGMVGEPGAVGVNGIARFDGTTWHTVGGGVHFEDPGRGNVYCLATMPNGDLIAGGNLIDTAGGQSVYSVARWDGTAWNAMSDGFNIQNPIGNNRTNVLDLLVRADGSLVATGTLLFSGSRPLSMVAVWNGTTWTPPPVNGPGADWGWPLRFNNVWAAAELTDGTLVAAGAAYIDTPTVYRWTGWEWQGLPGLTGGIIYDMLVIPGGDLIVGGNSFFVEGTYSCIARWDGNRWHNMALAGNGGVVQSLAWFGGEVIIGGSFVRVWDAAGSYSWGRWQPDAACVPPVCDDIDFNNNEVFPEDQDIVDYLDVLAGGECAACNDIDFNNNGVFPEDQDVIDFFNVLAGGTCP